MKKSTKKFNLVPIVGRYLPPKISDQLGWSLDGQGVREWLEAHGHVVTCNKDTGRAGIAITSEGFVVSNNGYVYRI